MATVTGDADDPLTLTQLNDNNFDVYGNGAIFSGVDQYGNN